MKPKNKPGTPLHKISAVVVSRGVVRSHKEAKLFVTAYMEICATELKKNNKFKLCF